ncbi:DUF4007 family protein [Spirulina sp. CS-785/01]|uniref:DUF4007 family protein n=1 Tax=Spirulina sp. CS-785/01 TaxID=3021716 RepID=UPI003FA79A86
MANSKSSHSTLESPVNFTFARHETFHPRYGWLTKGFEKARENGEIFVQPDAPVELGVGKNMVRSLRYWCRAFKLLEEDNTASSRSRPASATLFGQQLLTQWDNFLENPASLWLLHWNLLKPTCDAATWYYTFNLFRGVEFTDADLLDGLQRYQTQSEKTVAKNSLKKDISCLLRMYVEQTKKKTPLEDSIDSPFTELGLIQQVGGSNRYRFRIGAKANLPPEIITAACLEYVQDRDTNNISLSHLLYDENSPGLVFKLTESAMYDALEQVSDNSEAITLSDSAGLIQFTFKGEPQELAKGILEEYYTTVG